MDPYLVTRVLPGNKGLTWQQGCYLATIELLGNQGVTW